VDALIGALDKLIVKKRAIKLATMQQLLTGSRRLPGFGGTAVGSTHTNAGIVPRDWGVRELGREVDDLEAGVSVNSVEDETGVHSGDFYILKTSAVLNGAFKPNECKKVAGRDVKRVKLSPRENCVVISRMNTPDLVGECGYVDRNYPNLFLPDRLWMTRFRKGSEVCSRWLNFLLSSTAYKRKLKDIATGTSGSMKNISKTELLKLPIAWPDADEQRAIAMVLSDMDEGIAALERRLEKAKGIKRGMMQALLTGRTRLV
jgi:type I restriction enzyme S subunit